MTALHPGYYNKMVLYPCHCTYQFYVDNNGLSCALM
jgi:thymidylate synthase